MYQANKVKLPFQDVEDVYVGDSAKIQARDLRDYVEKFITKNILFSPKGSQIEHIKRIQDFDTSFLEQAAKGGTPEREFFDEYVLPFLMANNKQIDPVALLNYYNTIKQRSSNDNFKLSDLKVGQNTRYSAIDFRRKNFVDPTENLTTDISEWDDLASELETDGQFVRNFEDLRKTSVKDIRDFSDELRGIKGIKNIDQLILDLEDANRAGGRDTKKSIPVKLSISDINDINEKPFSQPLDYYTVLDNIPLETEVDSDSLRSIVGDPHYFPNKEPIKRELKAYSRLSDDIDVNILDTEEDSIEKIYPLNQSNNGSVYDEANKFENNFSVEDYLSYLKDPSGIIMTNPDELDSMRSNADEIAEIPKSIFTAKTRQSDLDRQEFIKGVTSANNNVNRTTFDRFYNTLDLEDQIDKIYVGNLVAKSMKIGNLQSIRKYFVSDENGNITKIPEGGKGRGIRYEHVVPINVLGELVGTLYDSMQEGGNFNEDNFYDSAKSLIKSLYTIAWIDLDEDSIITKSGLRETMPSSFYTKLAEMSEDGELDNQEENEIKNLIFSRYNTSNVQNNIQKINDVYENGATSISLSPIKNKQLRPKEDPSSGNVKIRESKKPLLTNLLFGYYG